MIASLAFFFLGAFHGFGARGYTFQVCRSRPVTTRFNPCVSSCWTKFHFIFWQKDDWTPCQTRGLRFEQRVCIGGNCINPQVIWPGPHPRPPSIQPRVCDREYRDNGYATSCTYTCPDGTQGSYPNETPCLMVSADNTRIGVAGLCTNGKCISMDDLEIPPPTSMVFPESLKQCPVKIQSSRNVLSSCNYYCSKGREWYYGHYASNSTCQVPGVFRLGWCCNGACFSGINCQGSELTPDNNGIGNYI